MIYVGIDPGATGALVAMHDGDVDWTAMPHTMHDILEWMKDRTSRGDYCYAVIEKVGGYVRGAEMPGSAAFNFGKGYGALLMALCAAGIPHEEVTPQVWMRGLNIPPRKKGEARKDWKNRLKAKAQQLFPREKATLVTADALLIAEYCRRKMTGILARQKDLPAKKRKRDT